MLIYLADLTHTGQIVASNVMPLGIGLVGANIVKEIPGAQVELFKYPDDLDRAFGRAVPDVVGFSNYSWNCNLGMAYAERIKREWPEITIVCGGPNYGGTDAEQTEWWYRFGEFVDYYIYREGEVAMVELLKQIKRGVDPDYIPGLHRLASRFAPGPRVKNLDDLPSPYTAGLMDKFFDGVLIPLLHSTRGCPFKCSFCQEGAAYYDQVSKRTRLAEDLDYIGQRVGTVQDLYISDANFGMFKEDRDKALAIAEAQRLYNWPRYIHVSGGKNHKERLLEVAGIIGGRMGVAASLQSTDADVLRNVRRQNISVAQLTDVAKEGSRIDANTYAEIILNLPGDTYAKHERSLRDAVNSGLSYLRMYQLIMLPETDMNTPETRAKFGMQTMWRIMPRCFGRYQFQGEEFASAEIEEICVAQDSLPFEDYIRARELDLTVEIFHNTNLFRELFGLCGVVGVEWFSLLADIHDRRGEHLADLYQRFREDTVKPLWSSREQALAFAVGNLDLYLTEQLGTNELFNAKAVAFFRLQEQLHDAIYSVATGRFPAYGEYLAEAKRWSIARKANLLEPSEPTTEHFAFDFPGLLEMDFAVDPDRYRRPVSVSFGHTAAQRVTIDQFVRQYGTSDTGLGRIMLRAHIKKLFREVTVDGVTSDKGFEQSYRRASNLYGD